jgi:hypothetical protein
MVYNTILQIIYKIKNPRTAYGLLIDLVPLSGTLGTTCKNHAPDRESIPRRSKKSRISIIYNYKITTI